MAPSTALPLGMVANPHEVKFSKVETGDILLHSVLAITFTPLPGSDGQLDAEGKPKIYTPEEETQLLLTSNVFGFIYISEVNDKKRKMTVLAPNPSRLPKNFFVMGTLKWMDE
jgi:polyribonucleotide 5'-hydroxyl-kinase